MKKLSWLPVILLIGFIFANSAMDGETSSGMSGPIAFLIQNILKLSTNLNTIEFIIRKLAHFSEYAVLGMLVFFAQKYCPLSARNRLVYLAFLIVPIIDENIQRFSEGRSCEIRDMLIDSCGYLSAIIILSLIYSTIIKRRKHNVHMES